VAVIAVGPIQSPKRTMGRVLPVHQVAIPSGMETAAAVPVSRPLSHGSRRSIGEETGKTAQK